MKGRVKSYNNSTRYGFITSADVDYRFHLQDWGLRLPPVEGTQITFDAVRTEKGLRAENIRLD